MLHYGSSEYVFLSLACGGVIRRAQGHIMLESYPINAHCEWRVQVERGENVELRWVPELIILHYTVKFIESLIGFHEVQLYSMRKLSVTIQSQLFMDP